jgi:replicative superfamily II helicase
MDTELVLDTFGVDVVEAVELLRIQQQHPKLTKFQVATVIALAEKKNSLNQLPTGSGKTWPVVCLPKVLDILRDRFGHDFPLETRVMYIVPLVNIFHSLSKEMDMLNISYQVMSAGSCTDVNPAVKVVLLLLSGC